MAAQGVSMEAAHNHQLQLAQMQARQSDAQARMAVTAQSRLDILLCEGQQKYDALLLEMDDIKMAADQKMQVALASLQTQLAEKAVTDTKFAVSLAETRCRESAAIYLAEAVAQSEKRFELQVTEREKQAAAEARVVGTPCSSNP